MTYFNISCVDITFLLAILSQYVFTTVHGFNLFVIVSTYNPTDLSLFNYC